MPQKQPMDSPNNALDSKTDIGVGPTGPPVAGVPTSGANGIPDVLSSDVTNVVDTSNASSSESNSLANMIPQVNGSTPYSSTCHTIRIHLFMK